MTRLERTWMTDIVSAFAPQGGEGLAPRPSEVDFVAVFQQMGRQATRKAAFGLRLAIWLVAFSPLLLGRGLRLFSHLRPIERSALLAQMLRHRVFAIRELTLLLKFVAAIALLGTESVRERSGYDLVQAPAADPAVDADTGIRHRLPVIREDDMVVMPEESPGELA